MTLVVHPWVTQFAASEPQGEERLSEEQKKTIISSLKGSCVQEGWDSLMARLPNLTQELILAVFLETLLLKEIYAGIFEAPFWYFDGKTNAEDQTGDDRFSERLQYLYERYLKSTWFPDYPCIFILIIYAFPVANPYSAAIRRSETTRLANSVNRLQAPNHELEYYHRDRRTAALSSMVDDVLASEPICWLLKKPANEEEENMRRRLLVSIYQKAADISPVHAAARGFLEFYRLDDLEKTFHEASDTLNAYNYHFLRKGNTKLDGRRVLLVVQPAIIWRWFNNDRNCERLICSKAEVVIEDPQDQNDAGAED